MTMPIVVADTSVLINFLKIDRMDLVGRYPGRLLATDHVESELAEDYPEQKARYAAAMTAGVLGPGCQSDQISCGVGDDMAFATVDLLAGVVAACSGFHRLAVDHAGRWTWLPADFLP